MSESRSLLLLSCSHHKSSNPGPGLQSVQSGRSFPRKVPDTGPRIFERRNEIRRMLRGEKLRLYDGSQNGGFRDENLANFDLANGQDFDGLQPARYLPAFERYTGRFFRALRRKAPNFWKQLPESVEIIFVSGLYDIVFWDEVIQYYDVNLDDYIEGRRLQKVGDLWSSTLSDALIEFLRWTRLHSVPIRVVYDLLSERLYQDLFEWHKIKRQGAAVYHRIFKGISGPDILAPLGRILATNISGFGDGAYRRGWQQLLTDGEEPLEFGFETRLGEDRHATREDIERTENDLRSKEGAWIGRLSVPLREALILAELSWQKAKDLPSYA
jgi:hypothetical protein